MIHVPETEISKQTYLHIMERLEKDSNFELSAIEATRAEYFAIFKQVEDLQKLNRYGGPAQGSMISFMQSYRFAVTSGTPLGYHGSVSFVRVI